MGACMAPAAADTIERHLEDFHVQPQEYDRIITGDLGSVGQTVLIDLLREKGIDIAGTRGQPVYAAGAGKVVYVGNQLRGYGNLIMIKHGEDYITAYAHNDTMLVNNGQNVKAGQKIATMGSTGTDSVKLHFQIRYKATAIDPLRYLPAPGSKPKC